MKRIQLSILSQNYAEENELSLKLVPMKTVTIFSEPLKQLPGYIILNITITKSREFLFLFFGEKEEITLLDNKIPGIIGFNDIHDRSGYHIVYKMLENLEKLTRSDDE